MSEKLREIQEKAADVYVDLKRYIHHYEQCKADELTNDETKTKKKDGFGCGLAIGALIAFTVCTVFAIHNGLKHEIVSCCPTNTQSKQTGSIT